MISKKEKLFVRNRAKNCCEYCACPYDFANQFFSIEHIIPKSKDGSDELNNLAFSCQCCNGHKYNITEGIDPINGELAPIFDPRKDKWQDNFRWSEDFLLIQGISAIGRVTVNTLDLNRENLVNLRAVLFAFGEHPPKHFQFN